MTGPTFKTQFGRIFPPRQDWLAKALPEPVLEPELPIIDTHHHVWRDRGGYMLDDVMADMSDAVAPRAKHAFHEQGLELLGVADIRASWARRSE